ncbi:MAG: MFS transporter [Hyphomicrobiaceae bacterium]
MANLLQRSGLPPAGLWFLAGTFASNIGNGMHTLAAGALLYQETGTIAAFGVVVAVEQAATFLMQLVAGPTADCGDPRRTALAAELVRGVCVCAIALMLATDLANAMALILAMTVVIRIVHAFHRAGTFALTPALVPSGDLARLNSWFSACQQGGQLVGLGVTGFIVLRWGPPAAFFINGLTFLLSAATLAAIKAPVAAIAVENDGSEKAHWRRMVTSWREFGVVLRQDVKLLELIVVSAADNVSLILFNLVLAPVVAERFDADPYRLSLIAGGFALGAMAASAIVVTTAERLGSSQNAVLLGLAGQLLCFVGMWRLEQSAAMLLFAIGLGIFNTVSWTMAVTMVQIHAPAAIRGRLAMARNAMTAAIVSPLVLVVSVVSHVWSNSAALLVCAVVCQMFLLLALAAAMPGWRDFGRKPPVSTANKKRS